MICATDFWRLSLSVYLFSTLQLVKQAVLPRVHGLALRTTVAVVRVNALLCFSDMVQILDKTAVLEILQTVQRCTAVDHSAPTLMCTLGLANSILKQHGVEFVAMHVLPLLIPLLITQQLNVQQFAKYMLFVKDVLRKIEEKRGVTLSDSGLQQQKPSLAAEGLPSGQINKTVSTAPSNARRSSAWDEDWTPNRPSAAAPQSTATSTAQPAQSKLSSAASASSAQPAQSKFSSTPSAPSTQQPASSCPAVDVEWPPKSSSNTAAQFGGLDILDGNKSTSDSNLDDIDPFANWPTRPSGNANVSGSMKNGTAPSPANSYGFNSSSTTSNGLGNQSSSWDFGMQTQNQGISSLPSVGSSNGGLSSQYSLGQLKQNHATSGGISSSTEKAANLDSIFASNKNDNTAPRRLAPPPATAVGRGRGRGRGNQGQTGQAKPRSGQPPLLDLL